MRGKTPSSSQGGFQFQRKVHAGRLEYTHFNMPSMERRTDPGKHVQAEIAGRLFESFIVKSCVATQDLKVLYVEVHSVSTEERVRRVWHFKSDACTHGMERAELHRQYSHCITYKLVISMSIDHGLLLKIINDGTVFMVFSLTLRDSFVRRQAEELRLELLHAPESQRGLLGKTGVHVVVGDHHHLHARRQRRLHAGGSVLKHQALRRQNDIVL